MRITIELEDGPAQKVIGFSLDAIPRTPDEIAAQLFYVTTLDGEVGRDSPLTYPYADRFGRPVYRVVERRTHNDGILIRAVHFQ